MPKLTKTFIESIESVSCGQLFYRDDDLVGFAVRVTKREKTFIVEKRVNGRNRRISIGKCGVISFADARQKARVMLSGMAQGNDPVNGSAMSLASSVTLLEAFRKYLSVRPLAEQTRKSYKYCIETCLSDWLELPFVSITKDMVEERHRGLTNSPVRTGSGAARANVVMRTLKSVLNFASERYSEDGEPLLKSNPVHRITANKQWNKRVVRDGVVAPTALAGWYDVVCKIPNEIARDYLLFLLFTGMRRSEAAQLKWSYVDFENQIIRVPGEITKMQRGHTVPMSVFLFELLGSRRRDQIASDWVFPSTRSTAKHIANVTHYLPELRRACGYRFRVHDLRRTFLTVGSKLQIPFHILKGLVNHKVDKEITDRYVIADPETKRECVERIAAELVRLTGANLSELIENRPAEVSKSGDTQLLCVQLAPR